MQPTYPSAQSYPLPQSPVHAPNPAPAPREYRTSYHGTGGGLFVLVFKNLLFTLLTLGIYLPWARTERRKYLWQNLEFDGHRLRYHGTGVEMLIGYLKVIGAYLAFVGLPLAVGQINATAQIILQLLLAFALLPLIPVALYGSQRYLLSRTSLRSVRFGLAPGAKQYMWLFLGGYLITAMTFGLFGPIWQNRLYAFVTNKTRFGSAAFGYDGPDSEAWRIGMKGLVLSVLTLGIYYPWFLAEQSRFRFRHTYIHGARARIELGGGDMFKILLVSLFGTLFSLGLAFPWITTYVMRTMASKISFVGHIDYDAIGQRAVAGDAAADGLADALDVGLEI